MYFSCLFCFVQQNDGKYQAEAMAFQLLIMQLALLLFTDPEAARDLLPVSFFYSFIIFVHFVHLPRDTIKFLINKVCLCYGVV